MPPVRLLEGKHRGKVPAPAAKQPATSFRANNGSVKTPAHHRVNPFKLSRFRNGRTTMHSQRQSLLCRFEDSMVAASIPSRFMTQVNRSSVEAGTVRWRGRLRSRQLKQLTINFPGGPTPTSTAREQMASRPVINHAAPGAEQSPHKFNRNRIDES